MVEISNPVGQAKSSQLLGYGNKMIIMDPHEIFGPSERGEGSSERVVDPSVADIIGSREIGEAHPVVHRWPECAVGEAVVVFSTI
jgi:hypothetical protein